MRQASKPDFRKIPPAEPCTKDPPQQPISPVSDGVYEEHDVCFRLASGMGFIGKLLSQSGIKIKWLLINYSHFVMIVMMGTV